MIIEIRHYTLHPNCREKFVTYFEQKNRTALRDAGMLVFGPLRDLDDPNKVHWMRAFSSLEERETIKDEFYGGSVWKNEIEDEVMPMIKSYEFELTETTSNFENFGKEPHL